VLADISGKGISGTLLMASLQALRGQYAETSADLVRVLHTLNRIFYESTAPSHYTTLFFGICDEGTRRLQYANCGHLPPVLRRVGGALERLAGTAPVVGVFDEWSCTSSEIALGAGDALVIFSDGVCDALSDEEEEFGEERLLEVIRAQPPGPAAAMLGTIVDAVEAHASATPFERLDADSGEGKVGVRRGSAGCQGQHRESCVVPDLRDARAGALHLFDRPGRVARCDVDAGNAVPQHGDLEPVAAGVEHRLLDAVVGGDAPDDEVPHAPPSQILGQRDPLGGRALERGVAVCGGVHALRDENRSWRQPEVGMKLRAGGVPHAMDRPGSTVFLEVRGHRRMPVARGVHRQSLADRPLHHVIEGPARRDRRRVPAGRHRDRSFWTSTSSTADVRASLMRPA
jgi:hypothetical protein